MDSIRFMLVFLISIVFLMSTEANDANVTTNSANVTANGANGANVTANGANVTTNHEHDEVWQARAAKARQAALEAYHPNPHEVINHLNKQVHLSMSGHNNTTMGRRNLRAGGCVATNPIDQCWRCKDDWAENRKRLADCALGFGRKTTGGKAGKFYVVTDASDNDLVNPKNGTLRHAVIQTEPLWITFKTNMFIKLKGELIMTSNKTIDGRGVQVHITGGAGLTLQFISNVIIHNIKIYDIKVANGGLIRDSLSHFGNRGNTDGDAVNMFGATNIWLDHLSLSNCYDGLIDAVESSTAITISNCHFTHHNDVLLFGARDNYSADKIMQITLAFNHFGRGLIQRMPRVRWGFAHVVNNDYTKWEMYAIGGSQNPTILSQGNFFMAPDNRNAKEVTKREYTQESVWKNWVWKSEEDVLMNGAFFVQSGDKNHKFDFGENLIPPKSGTFAKVMAQHAGHLKCIPGVPS